MTTDVSPVSRSLSVNSLQLHHLDWGNDNAPALICVHGLRGNAHVFDTFARRFADRYHVIALDVRGRGDSDWSPSGAYQYEDYVSDLEAIVDQLGLAMFSYIGTSMGGRIGMTYAIHNADRLTRFILNDIGPDNEAGSDRITREAGESPESFPSFESAVDYLRATTGASARMSEGAVRERARYSFRERADGRWIAKNDPEFLRQRSAGRSPGSTSGLWEVLEALPCPTLLLWGTVSDVLSEEQARKIVQTLSNGTLAPVPGVGHTPTLDEPAAVEALERFLGESD
jgi:pimeloyl-ACP methyl ester carboxylesterase